MGRDIKRERHTHTHTHKIGIMGVKILGDIESVCVGGCVCVCVCEWGKETGQYVSVLLCVNETQRERKKENVCKDSGSLHTLLKRNRETDWEKKEIMRI